MKKFLAVLSLILTLSASVFAETRRVSRGRCMPEGMEYVSVSFGKIGEESVSYTIYRNKENYSLDIVFNNGEENKVTYRFVNMTYPFINYIDSDGYEYHSISLKRMFEKAADLEAYSDLTNQEVCDTHVYNLYDMTDELKQYTTLADDGSFVYDGSAEVE
jgi:hypothetical protein